MVLTETGSAGAIEILCGQEQGWQLGQQESRAQRFETPRPLATNLPPRGHDRSLYRLLRRWHGSDAGALRRRGLCSSSCRLRMGHRQSQSLAHFDVQLGHGVLVVFQELPGIFASLADTFALVAVP